MKTVATEITIAAAPGQVWSVLTDFESYPQWNPFIRELSGELRVGARLKLCIQLPGERALTFRPKLRTVAVGEELRWLGHLGFPGLFDGEHGFWIQSTGQNQVCLQQGERFSGILSRVWPQVYYAKTCLGFEMMNRALKERVERLASRS